MNEEVTPTPQAIVVEGPVGLGGWLILPAVNMVLQLLQLSWGLNLLVLLKSGDPRVPVPEGLDVHDPAWTRLLNYEFNTCILMMCLLAVLLVLFFARSWLFPKAFIAFWALNLLLQFLDLMQVHGVETLDVDAYHGSFTALIMPVIYCVGWGSYVLTSVRVRNTFTRPWPVAKPSGTGM